MHAILYFLFICGLVLLLTELSHRLKAISPLTLNSRDWEIIEGQEGLTVKGILHIGNPHPTMEVMVPEISIKTTLLGKRGVKDIKVVHELIANHPDENSREDGYWTAYIVKSKKHTEILVNIDISNNQSSKAIEIIENVLLNIHWSNYGPFGILNRQDSIVIPIKQIVPLTKDNAYFTRQRNCQLLPIKTHLLGCLDNIEDVMQKYVGDIVQAGDVITIGETPLAITQGRYKHPKNIKPTRIAKLLCKAFLPTSSLATACGMQTLIDLVGPSRVIGAWIIASFARIIKIRGVFYMLAGSQARLIDDITGTTPPYDQTIVLGPLHPQSICMKLSKQLGAEIAIVDVNDLGSVKILAASGKCDQNLVKEALRSNPAGNANQQTPIVIVRP